MSRLAQRNLIAFDAGIMNHERLLGDELKLREDNSDAIEIFFLSATVVHMITTVIS